MMAIILIGGYCLLWVFHYYIPNPYPNAETYKLLLIYLSIVAVTGLAFSTLKLINIHQAIGFHYFKIKYLIGALLIAGILWLLDYYYQINVLHVNMQDQAKKWLAQQDNLTAAFISTVILAPIIEEMVFRGVLFKTINKYLSQFWTVLLLSAVFSSFHYSIIQTITLFIASVFYFWLSIKSKSIVPAITAHIINNALVFYYYLSFS